MPADVEEPKQETARERIDRMRKEAENRTNDLLDRAMEGDPIDKPEEPPAEDLEAQPSDEPEVEEPEEEEPEEEEPEEEEPEEEEPEEGGEFDYDDPAGEEEPEEEEDEPDDPDERETIAQKQARENGREVKRLRTEITEKDLELDRIRKERDELNEKLSDFEKVSVDPRSHPDYKQGIDAVFRDVDRAADKLPDRGAKAALRGNFGSLISQYLDADKFSGEERDAKMESLKWDTANTLFDVGKEATGFADLDSEDHPGLVDAVDRVHDLLERQASKVEELNKLADDIKDRSKSGRLEIGRKEYERQVKQLRPSVDAVGDMEEDLVEANPYSLPAIVAKMSNKDPKFKERVDQARRDALEVLLGPRPLTQEEIDKIDARGDDVAEFLAAREKTHAEKVRKHAAMHVEMLALRHLFAKQFKESSERARKEKAEDSELSALGSLGKRKKPRKPKEDSKPKKPEGAARDRPLAIESRLNR